MRSSPSALPALTLVAALLLTASQVMAQTTAPAAAGTETGATALLERHASLANELAQNPYRRPLFIESSEGKNNVNGDAYAVLDAPFATVSSTFKSPARWCDVLILHLNTKACRANAEAASSKLTLHIGKKTEQQLDDAVPLEFAYRVASTSASYMAVHLNAAKGPLGTNNYRIELQAVPLPQGKTFMHLRYSYGFGVASRLAMTGYLATAGNGKVGFTQSAQGQTAGYVGGVRGAVERNTMRYYLAIEAYLASLKQPASKQLDARLDHWFDATEDYARQLHEIDKASYLSMKKAELERQATTPAAPS